MKKTYTKTGLGGLAGNKGGVTTRLTLLGREICIVGKRVVAVVVVVVSSYYTFLFIFFLFLFFLFLFFLFLFSLFLINL